MEIIHISLFALLLLFASSLTVFSRPNPDHPLGRNHQSTNSQRHGRKTTQFHHQKHVDYKWQDIRDISGLTDHITYDTGTYYEQRINAFNVFNFILLEYKPPGHPVEKILGNQPLYVSIASIKARYAPHV